MDPTDGPWNVCSSLYRFPTGSWYSARILREVLDGNVDESRLSNPELVALNRLRHAGLVTDDGAPDLTAEVKASLLLEGET